MELYYHRSVLGNFGDDLNAWLWDELLPGWRDWDPGRVLVGVGTLLSSTIIERELVRRRRYPVVGAGVGYGDGRLPDVSDRSVWDVRALRGPHSARSLGLPSEIGMLDPAIMIAGLPGFRAIPATGRPVFVPHESTVERHDWSSACADAGLDFVSPRGDARQVIARIAGASTVLAESMHAAIMADAFRVPWIPVRIGHRFLDSKWRDWASSLDLHLGRIPRLFPIEDRGFALPRLTLAAMRVCSRRHSRSAAASRATAPEIRPFRPGVEERLQVRVEAAHIAGALRRHLRRVPLLSEDARLTGQMGRFRNVLETIRNDYG